MKTITITTILAGAMLLSSCGKSENRYQMQVITDGTYTQIYILDGENGELFRGQPVPNGFGMDNIGSVEDVPEAGNSKFNKYTDSE